MQKMPFEVEALKQWFVKEKRDLPWRQCTDPYAIWISEIMLQQTQVAVVKDYFIRWMTRFPTIESLARSPIEEVIKLWEGLGYYSRARNLHEAARYLVEYHQGKLPMEKAALEKVKGLGPYTVGALLSFAFKQRAPAVDGNAIRVLTRYFAIEEDVKQPEVIRKIWKIAEEILPEDAPWVVVEGLIELGATVCKRDPQCFQCPLHQGCQGLKKKIQSDLPVKSPAVKITLLERLVFVIECQGFLLLRKGEKGKLMADLYEFPYSDVREKHFPFPCKAVLQKTLPPVSHSFTRYRVKLYPSLWNAVEQISIPGYDWIPMSEAVHLPFSAGHRKIYTHYRA